MRVKYTDEGGNEQVAEGFFIVDGQVDTVNALSAPNEKTPIVGNVLEPTTASIANIITELAGSGYTQLILKFKRTDGKPATEFPVLYYVLNSTDPTTALATTTDNRFLALGDEVSLIFSSDDPLTSVDIKPVGDMSETIVGWEYR